MEPGKEIFTRGHMTLLVVLILLLCGFTFILLNNDHNKKVDVYISELKGQDSEIKELTNANESCSEELNNLKQTISDRAPDEILFDDIARYINTNFPTIPNILCTEIAVQIATLSRQENVAPELVVGIIQVESSFNPMAISSKNARGLMQVMPMWAKHFKYDKVCSLHNVNIGILTGIKVLKIHIEEEDGDISEGLYKYVNKDRSYVERVYNAMGKFVMFRGLIADKKGGVDDTNGSTAEAYSGPA
jgi:cell division protein FtsB